MDYKKKYEDAIERCKKEFNFNNLAYSHEEIRERLEHVFPELKETNDEIMRKELIKLMKRMSNTIVEIYTTIEISTFVAWLEKQDKKDSQVFPTVTFDDIVALQCCMKKVQKDKELYNQIQTLHDRLHDAYWLGKQDEQKSTNKIEPKKLELQKNEQKKRTPKWDELTWVDINTIEEIINEVHHEYKCGIGEESFGEEVLERFKETKDEKCIDTCEQNPAWSEEDERILEVIIREIEANKAAGQEYDEKVYEMFLSWLKSLKERMKGE